MSKRSEETNLLIQYLQECAAQDKLATFAGMAVITGMSKERYKGRLACALKILEAEYGKVFQSRLGIGYRPIQTAHVATLVTKKRQQRIQGETVRWDSELKTINPEKLTAGELKDYIKCRFKLAGQQVINSGKAQIRLEQKAETALPRYTGLEFAKEAAMALRDVS